MSLITYLTRIHFADRVLEDALPEELVRLGIRRPLILADADGAMGDSLDRLTDSLPCGLKTAVLVGAAGPQHLAAETPAAVLAGNCDAIIGLGGRTALDTARGCGRRGGLHPVIAVPTTTGCIGVEPLGAGAPVSEGGDTLPAVVLCDPTLTLPMAAQATAACGMEAVVHCVEAYLATAYNPPADGMALEGLRRAADHLERAVADGRDLHARREMLAAALNAGLAARKGFGSAEALARALAAGAGARTGALLPSLVAGVLHFNAPAVGHRYPALAEALRLPPGMDAAEGIAALGARIGLPLRLGALAPAAPARDRAAQEALADPASRTNPRHVTADDYRRMIDAAC